LAGWVGGLRSPAAKAGEVLKTKTDMSTMRMVATLTATPLVRQKGMLLIIFTSNH
jgi:hypothetical protein